VVALLAGFALLAIYPSYVLLHVRDLDTNVVYAQQSLKEYREALGGVRGMPYQWRLLGIYLVRGAELLTGRDPNSLDAAIKALLLWLSSTLLFQFARAYTTELGAVACAALFLVLDAAAFTDGYTIYFTNDYLMIALWFAAVFLVRERRYAAAAAVTAVGALAKETMLLVPILVGIEWLRRRATLGQVVLIGLAFAVPTAVMRALYPAPLAKWAWWDMLYRNVPFLQSSRAALLETMRYNLKVVLFYNAAWFLAARAVLRRRDPFVADLALTLVIYLVLAYPVIYIRELRHFLPLAILILPMAVSELDGGTVDPTRSPAPAR
jgi:hypothetical protein